MPGCETAWAVVMQGLPGAEALAGEGLWGVLIGILSAGVIAFGALVANQRLTLGSMGKDRAADNKRMDVMLETLSQQAQTQVEVVRSNTEAMTKVGEALHEVKDAVRGVAQIVQECPRRNGN